MIKEWAGGRGEGMGGIVEEGGMMEAGKEWKENKEGGWMGTVFCQ